MCLKWMLIPLLATLPGLAQELPKPPCNARNHGMLWSGGHAPDARGPIELCALNVWKYRWEPLTVDASRASKDRKSKSQGDKERVPAAESRPLSKRVELVPNTPL